MSPRRLAFVLLAPLALACTDSTQPSYVDGVRLSPEYAGIGVGETMVLEAIPLGRNDEPLPDRAERVEFRAGNSSIVSIEPLGDGRVSVTGLELGNTFIEGTLGRGSGSTLMFVQPPGLDRVRIEPGSATIGLPGFVGLTAILLDADGNTIDGDGFTYKWTTSNASVADFIYDYTKTLSVRARGRGSATMTVRVGSKTASATVTVQ
jgi:hypothetical protein